MEHGGHHVETNNKAEYYKLAAVFIFILWLGVVLTRIFAHWHWMHLSDNIMAAFFLVFGAFKLINLSVFANGYREYDLIAKRFAPWGYLYPFVELLLGVVLVWQFAPLAINSVVLGLMIINSIGVYKKLQSKDKPHCVCLGSVIKLPLSTITLYENVIMGLMALIMVVAMLLGISHA